MTRDSKISSTLLAATLLSFSTIFAADAADSVSANVAAAVADKSRPAEDTARDADRKPAESAAFSTVKPGDKILELIGAGGYFTRILSKAVGPTGKVYVTVPDAQVAARPTAADKLKAIAADPAYPNVSVLVQPNATPSAPEPVDIVWTSLNYHDMHNTGSMGVKDHLAMNKAILAALKPGGVYLVIDHAAAAGTGFTQTGTLHRVDPAAVKAEILAAGFVFDGESKVLSRPADDHTAKSDDKDDQFIYRFKKP